jgi:uncharacterized protein YnzC (UPF0291/DUF896 family)
MKKRAKFTQVSKNVKKAINKINYTQTKKKHTTLFCKEGRRDQTYPSK